LGFLIPAIFLQISIHILVLDLHGSVHQFALSHDSGWQRQTCVKPEAVVTV